MTTIGYATLQLIPSLLGVTEAIDKQIDGKVVSVSITPKVDQKAVDTAGKQVKDTIEKQTTEVAVKPKVDQPAAETAGKQAKETVEKHTGDVKVVPRIESAAITNAGATAGELAGRAIGEQIAKTIPTGMSGIAGSVGNILRSALPGLGSVVGAGAGAAIVTSILDGVSRGNYTKAGESIKRGLVGAVDKANIGTDIAIRLGNSLSGGLSKASDKIATVAGSITGKVSEVGNALTTTKELIGGDDAWGAGAIDTLNNALGTATPLLEGMNAAAVLASAGANAIAFASKAAAAAQRLWNLAMTANPIGLIVVAVGALVAGIIYAYQHSERFRAIVDAAWKAIKIAAEAVVKWFMDTAWPMLKRVWEGIGDGWSWLVTKAGEVWTGVKEKFTAIVDFVKGMPSAITNAAKGMWDGLKNGLVTVLNWIGDKWNAVADTLSIEVGGTKISAIPHMPKFDGGGYTGNVSAQQIAGVVHGDEFVIKSKSRKGIENAYPGLLDYLNNQGKLPGYAQGGLVKGTAELSDIISQQFRPSGGIGGYRSPDGKFNEHSTGRALDVMVGNDKAKGDAVKDFVLSNAAAIDLKWAIWRQHLYYPGGGGYDMEDRGSPTDNHMDHVHIFSGPGIANGLLGSLQSKTAAAVNAGTKASGPPVGDAPGGSLGAEAVSAAAPGGGSSSTGGGFNLPSSLSGLSGIGLAGMGVTTQVPGQPERTFEFGNAAAAAVGGQVSSALGVLGVGDSPGWLKGISQFVSGISVGGGGSGGGLGGAPEGAGPGARFGGATPIAASAAVPAPAALPAGTAHGAGAGAQPGPVFNTTISAFDTSSAVSIMRQQQDEMAAAKLGRWS
ncbi:Bacteriophage tape measure protein (TMP) [Mycobacteroides abscessus subsp. abscessus]|uniref:phage tail protein n=1 Tax=Mycobacteroides abscessus TaxID=36809 RepID=UPI0009291D91|nr:phage tail protein [Mycobacteroides abscessus]SHY40686.1 Bacteriophage tape measure protein (TMP) [Mycobacteroides abscessus subsp. abscessus]SIB47837.1 Bacteriophage tape measure protein (TMP) [Mycobacteroides abscessus subsp. abscessus]SIB94433.1 Bacteriophage tape measure protein (TMP) [Mycobacteroides abscessus subsp. abscessus]SIC01029.1 Bacteriophage tape measure protein (TMP) [Mycobacteroides abscessus subsp. abscessus]SIC60291.1 Bacteriophage tape measure protein (TMP) [Mycobacteroi